MSKYSFIVPYRNRETHLRVFVSHIRKFCERNQLDAEIIVVNQDNDEPFLRGQLLNTGAQHASSDVLIFHDVDYLAKLGTEYWTTGTDVFLPVKKAEFILADGSPRPEQDIPSGYRHFKDGVDENFFGAVTTFSKDAFFKINGFPSILKGWGVEDAILRHRCEHYGLTCKRGTGEFEVLPHPDSFPGAHDRDFQLNQQHETTWRDELEYGVDTMFPIVTFSDQLAKKWHVDKWIDASVFLTCNRSFASFMTAQNVSDFYEDIPEKHVAVWNSFKSLVNAVPVLKAHRDYIVHNQLGYGNRAFHWMWNLLIREAPVNFKFLEVGVYKGAIINLISLLNRDYKKQGQVFGVTPLTNVDDEFSKHDPHSNYEMCIQQLYSHFGLDASDLNLIVGLSQDQQSLQLAQENGPYDFVYIDGCHSAPIVNEDFTNYKEMVKLNGYLVADDASNFKQIPDGLIRMDWRGLMPVSEAVKNIIESDDRFIEFFTVGHNRVFRRIK